MNLKVLAGLAVFGVALLIIGSGCGGGGPIGSSPSPVVRTHLGIASITYIGKPSQVIDESSVSSTISVAGMAGATFTSLALSPTPNLEDSSVVFLSSPNEISLISANGSGGGGSAPAVVSTNSSGYTQVLTSPEPILSQPTFTQDGRILFNHNDPTTGKVQIFACYCDGTGVTQLTKSGINHMNPVTSPNNKLIAFDDGGGHIYTMPLTAFSTETKLAITGNASQPAWAPTSTSIAFVVAASGYGQIDTVALATLTSLTPISKSVGTQCSNPTWSPDGTKVSFQSFNSATGLTTIATVDPNAPTYVISLTGGYGYDVQPSYSPDSKSIFFERYYFPSTTGSTSGTTGTTAGTTGSTSSTGGGSGTTGTLGPASLVDTAPDGDNETTLSEVNTGLPSLGAVCSGYLNPVTLIGTAGTTLSSGSGFLWAQNGNAFGSFVSFAATTATKATITPAPNGNGLVYDLHADAITGLKYSNHYYEPGVSATTGSGVTDVLVSFDVSTGQLDTVAPFVAVKGLSKAMAKTGGSQTTYVGHFAGVWDATGKNRAPKGASAISLDAKSGRLVDVVP